MDGSNSSERVHPIGICPRIQQYLKNTKMRIYDIKISAYYLNNILSKIILLPPNWKLHQDLTLTASTFSTSVATCNNVLSLWSLYCSSMFISFPPLVFGLIELFCPSWTFSLIKSLKSSSSPFCSAVNAAAYKVWYEYTRRIEYAFWKLKRLNGKNWITI